MAMFEDVGPVKGQAGSPNHPNVVTTKRKFLYALLGLLVVGVVVAVPVTVTQFTVHRRNTRASSSSGSRPLCEEYCNRLQEPPRSYCRAYLQAKGPQKFMAASVWLQANQTTRECGSYSCT